MLFALFWYSLYSSGLELNSQCFQITPVVTEHSPRARHRSLLILAQPTAQHLYKVGNTVIIHPQFTEEETEAYEESKKCLHSTHDQWLIRLQIQDTLTDDPGFCCEGKLFRFPCLADGKSTFTSPDEYWKPSLALLQWQHALLYIQQKCVFFFPGFLMGLTPCLWKAPEVNKEAN